MQHVAPYGTTQYKTGWKVLGISLLQPVRKTTGLSHQVPGTTATKPIDRETVRGSVVLALYRGRGPGDTAILPVLLDGCADLHFKKEPVTDASPSNLSQITGAAAPHVSEG